MRWLAICFLGLCGSIAEAQVIYEPVQYQFGGQNAYYYGGSDLRVHATAGQLSAQPGFGRSEGFAFASGNVTTHREVNNDRPRVFDDRLPGVNATIYGVTIDDARNAAYQNSPTYFRKRDLPAALRRGDSPISSEP